MTPSDDSFISEEEEEFCPLCVEEMDISDKNFKPCPCGYQICQFCYNNIRQNPELNGRCPACRRLYDDESVEYKSISAEEYRLQQVKREKREKEKKQREKEKKETEMANKKHLAGLRVVQKNLVYVTGLNPPCNPDDLHSVLRSDKYFGQYGKILKIVINKKTPNPTTTHHHHSHPGLVVYVTFAKKEDALKCINELDGSLCDGRILRAAHGTTKYCSSYLRGHPCPNPNCMFLHEPGEEADSYTRKDLSTQQGIKMGMMGLTGSRNVNGTNTYNSDEDQHHTDDEENGNGANLANLRTAFAGASSVANNGPVLPATAQWAKGTTNSSSASPSVNNNVPLANAAAFPTLGEIFKDQKHQVKRDLKQKIKPSKTGKDSNILLPDDIDIDDDSAIQFIEETANYLRSLSEKKQKLNVHFDLVFDNGSGSPDLLPLFVFDPEATYTNDTKLEDEKTISRQVIERYLFRPIKNYHLSYQNHPITQQTLLQQQQQQQQSQLQPQSQFNPIQQLQVEQQKKLLEQHQQQQYGNDMTNLQQQQQQQLLLQQLQQQQATTSNAVQTPTQIQAQINALRMNERSANTSTPPPPGLFAGSKVSGQQQTYPPHVTATAGAHPSSSSQLLTQLMNGKR